MPHIFARNALPAFSRPALQFKLIIIQPDLVLIFADRPVHGAICIQQDFIRSDIAHLRRRHPAQLAHRQLLRFAGLAPKAFSIGAELHHALAGLFKDAFDALRIAGHNVGFIFHAVNNQLNLFRILRVHVKHRGFALSDRVVLHSEIHNQRLRNGSRSYLNARLHLLLLQHIAPFVTGSNPENECLFRFQHGYIHRGGKSLHTSALDKCFFLI